VNPYGTFGTCPHTLLPVEPAGTSPRTWRCSVQLEVGDLVRYYCESNYETYIGIISDPDTITWFCDGEKEDVVNYVGFPLEVVSKNRDERQLMLDF
jgi:hypothetical protein